MQTRVNDIVLRCKQAMLFARVLEEGWIESQTDDDVNTRSTKEQ
jgi:hypothetical protein